jgi:hypothetical protein
LTISEKSQPDVNVYNLLRIENKNKINFVIGCPMEVMHPKTETTANDILNGLFGSQQEKITYTTCAYFFFEN